MVDARRARSRKRTWRPAIVAVAASHAGLFALLGWQLGRTPAPPTAPTINVQLVTLAPRDRPPPPPEQRRAPPVRPRPHEAPGLAVPPTVEPRMAEQPASDPDAGVRRALRGSLGCRPSNLMNLSPDERRRCEDREVASAAQGLAGPPGKLDLSRSGRIRGDDPEPYLQRRPKNGCKARAGGSKDPMGKEGAAGGIACAWAF